MARILWHTRDILHKSTYYVNFHLSQGRKYKYNDSTSQDFKHVARISLINLLAWENFHHFGSRHSRICSIFQYFRFTVADADDFGFYILWQCLLCCATNSRLSLREAWHTRTTHAHPLAEVVVNSRARCMWLLYRGALVIFFFFLWRFVNGGEGYIKSIQCKIVNIDLIS